MNDAPAGRREPAPPVAGRGPVGARGGPRVDASLRDRWLAHAHERIASTGRRSGAVRSAVVEVLASEGQCLVTTFDVIDLLKARGSGSHASVYRVVDELCALRLLHRFDGRDGVARYEIADPAEHHHHHLVDDGTGRVEPFTDGALERAVHEIAERHGFDLTGHEVVLRGTFRGGR